LLHHSQQLWVYTVSSSGSSHPDGEHSCCSAYACFNPDTDSNSNTNTYADTDTDIDANPDTYTYTYTYDHTFTYTSAKSDTSSAAKLHMSGFE